MPSKVDQTAIVDDQPVGILADHRGLHAIVEDLVRRAADRLQGGDVAAQGGLQVLVGDEPRPDKTREAEHHGEQPDDAGDTGLVGECELETGEIDLGLLARRRLEAHLEWLDRLRPDVADGPLHRRVTAAIASLTQLATQPHGREARIGRQALPQIG